MMRSTFDPSPREERMVVLHEPAHEMRPRVVLDNPSQDQLRRLTLQMPNARRTADGSIDVFTRVDSRSSGSTYIVSDTPEDYRGHQTMPRAEYEEIVRLQEEYITGRPMIVIDGHISNAEEVQTAARLVIERANANVAGMQKFLYFERRGGEPQVTVIDTPNLPAPGYPNDRCIAVVGESKKGGLRMWNKIVYDKGGLPMHAGCKIIPTAQGEKTIVVIGLSGTGKTTTTFRRQGNSRAVQDDFIALMPGGKVYGTENGCFAKTFSLNAEYEPEIYRAVKSPITYLENVYLNEDGTPDFFNESFTQNGRAVFPLEALGRYEDANKIGPVNAIVILNRARSVVPALAKLTEQQAAAYFMLGETQGTSAGGKDEAGKEPLPRTAAYSPDRRLPDEHRLDR
ncbi:MAG: phosphoenolpyruvate carboxykinase (ATP) [Chloroflexi bacterium]|nr:MAG: phosphoenolpyruvate carboxykinase (ATP) [Chloroflexota bacterium]